MRAENVMLLWVALAATTVLGSCKPADVAGRAQAFRIESRGQLIGGPTALGDVGDYMLENGKVRVIVQDKVFNRGSGVFGGSLIDADLARATNVSDVVGGSGNDSFGEMFPAFFLEMIDPNAVEVIADGSDGNAAIVEVSGRGGEFITMLRYLNQLLLSTYKEPSQLLADIVARDAVPPDSDSDPNLHFRTRYILEPGVRSVRIESTMTNVSNRVLEMPPRQVLNLLQSLAGIDLGDFRVPAGHVIGFGKLSDIFLPGLGYDVPRGLIEASADPVPLPGFPGFLTPIVGSTNEHGVNYGFMMEDEPDTAFVYQLDQDGIYGGRARTDDMLYLFNASGFGGVFTARAPAKLAPSHCAAGADPQSTCEAAFADATDDGAVAQCVQRWADCLAANETDDSSFTFTNYLLIGDGDVASLWEEYYRIRDTTVHPVRGRVRDAAGGMVRAKESVLVYEDVGATCDEARIYSQVYTIEGGRFELQLPSGKYCARAHASGRPLGEFVAFDVDGATSVELTAAARATLIARVTDDAGNLIPAKLTVVGVHDYVGDAPNYRAFLMDQVAGEPHRPTDLIPDTADPATRQYIEGMAYGGADGLVQLDLRPGKYTVYLSRGPEYDIATREVTLAPGKTHHIAASLPRSLDTTGYINGDFHLHQAGSIDSGLDNTRRIRSVGAEGVELLVATEHNYLTDLEPWIYQAGMQRWMKSIVGIELTTFEAGHFNAFPVERTMNSMNRGSFAWQEIPPDRIFAELRSMAPPGEDNIVQVNHPRTPIMGYFEQHNLNPFDGTVEVPYNGAGLSDFAVRLASPNGSAFIETVQNADGTKSYKPTFSWDFDAIEIFNGPHLEELRHFRMPFDKDAAPGTPGALPKATYDGLYTSYIEEAGTRLNRELAAFLTARDGEEVTEAEVAALPEAELDAATSAWVHSKIPPQWSVLCDGDDIVSAGGLDDWYNLLNYPRPDGTYRRYTATGNSDSHSDHFDPPGLPRNYFYVGHDDITRVTAADVVTALQRHHNIVSNGPFVNFTVNDAPLGSEVTATGTVTIDVHVGAVPWIGADRMRIVSNGEVVRGIDPAQETDAWGWLPITLDDRGEWSQTFTVDTEGRDRWFVVEVESDKSMFPIIEPQDIPPFNFNDVIGSLAGAFGFGAGVEGLDVSFVFPVTGFAFTNPIWVIADGDGVFTPPSPPVQRCDGGVYGVDEDPNALIDLEQLQRSLDGRLRMGQVPHHEHEPNPLERPVGEKRDLRAIFRGHAH